MESQIEVLIVSTDDVVVRTLEDALRDGGLAPRCHRVGDAQALQEALVSGSWDIVLAELESPDFGAAEAVELLAENGRDIPLIAIPDRAGLEPIVAMFNKGLRNVVSRDHLESLVTTVELEMNRRDARKRQRELESELRRQANHDSLTDLPNRRLFFDRLSQGLKRARRQRGRLSLLFIDLDDFKAINDNRGHAFGDALLQEVARRLESTIRESDTAARLGGDEFAVILDGVVEDGDAAAAVASKIRDSLSRPFQLAGGPHEVSASIGAATYPTDGEDVDTLLSFADASMYRQKKRAFRGRSRAKDQGGEESEVPDVPMPGTSSLLPGRFRSPIAWAAAVPAIAALFIAGWLAMTATTDADKARVAGDESSNHVSDSKDIEMAPASGPSE